MTTVRAAALAALIAVCAPGCGSRTTPTRALDEALAREALVEALDSWKSGRPHGKPSEDNPSLRVADEDWLAGRKLADYRVLPGEQVVGSRMSFPVVLELEGPGGRRAEAQVAYLVATDPTSSVIRSD